MKKNPGMYLIAAIVHCNHCGYHGQLPVRKASICLVCNSPKIRIVRAVWTRQKAVPEMRIQLLG